MIGLLLALNTALAAPDWGVEIPVWARLGGEGPNPCAGIDAGLSQPIGRDQGRLWLGGGGCTAFLGSAARLGRWGPLARVAWLPGDQSLRGGLALTARALWTTREAGGQSQQWVAGHGALSGLMLWDFDNGLHGLAQVGLGRDLVGAPLPDQTGWVEIQGAVGVSGAL